MSIRYEAEVTGHEPPFRWKIVRHGPGYAYGGSGVTLTGEDVKGEADTFEEACFAALEAAKRAEWKRRHDDTTERVPLFEVTEPEPTGEE